MQAELVKRQEAAIPDGVERIARGRVFLPRADIFENQDQLSLMVDMPGVDEKSVEITLEKNTLSIRGKSLPR